MQNVVASIRHLSPGAVTRGSVLALVVLVGGSGCPVPDFTSDEGQLTFQTPDLYVGAGGGFANGVAVLEQTPVCATCTEATLTVDEELDVELSCGDGAEYDALACFDQGVEGGALEEGCVVAAGPGEVTWSFAPVDCPLQDAGAVLVPDQVRFTFVEQEATEGVVEQWIEDAARDWYDAGILAQPDGSGFDEALRNPEGEPFRVVAGEPFRFWVHLREIDGGEPVAWTPDDGALTVEPIDGGDVTATVEDTARIVVTAAEGAEAEIRFTLGDQTWAAGRVLGVAASEVASLEVVAAVYAEGQDGAGTPFAARAVMRDADGHAIYGAPVKWTVRGGQLALGDVLLTTPGADYVETTDACVPPDDGSPREMTLKASYKGRSDSVDFAWDPPDPEDGADTTSWERAETCTGGCSCRSDGPGATPAALAAVLALGGLLAVRRRSGAGTEIG